MDVSAAPFTGAVRVTEVTEMVKVAESVTALSGMVKIHGLLDEPPEHDAPITFQMENCQLEDGFAPTVIEEPTALEQPLAQLGESEPEPEATFVVKVCSVVVDETDVVVVVPVVVTPLIILIILFSSRSPVAPAPT